MGILIRVIVGLLAGALGGVVFGAAIYALYGLPYMPAIGDTTGGLLNMGAGEFLLFGATAGAICGVLPGAVIGFAVGAMGLGKFHGALVGAGIIVAFAVFFLTRAPHLDQDIITLAIMSVPAAAVVGTIVGATCNRLRRREKSHIQSRPERYMKGHPSGGSLELF